MVPTAADRLDDMAMSEIRRIHSFCVVGTRTLPLNPVFCNEVHLHERTKKWTGGSLRRPVDDRK